MEDDQTDYESSYSISPLVTQRGIALSESKRAETCQQFGDLVSAGDRCFCHVRYWDGWRGAEVLLLDPCQRTQVNQPCRGSGSHQGYQGLQVSGSNGIPNRALKHLPQRAFSFLAQIVNAVLRAYHFPLAWKDGRVISILKPIKDPALPSSYRPISLLYTIGKTIWKDPIS